MVVLATPFQDDARTLSGIVESRLRYLESGVQPHNDGVVGIGCSLKVLLK